MRKREASKTVEFANLPEDHKAEFIQFLIKNNICFQEGKENCTARVSIKQPKNQQPPAKPLQERTRNDKPDRTHPLPKQKPRELPKPDVQKENTAEAGKQLKTPTKDRKRELAASSLSCKGRSNTLKKPANCTPRSVKPKYKQQLEKQVSEYDHPRESTQKVQPDPDRRDRENLVVSRERASLEGLRERGSVEVGRSVEKGKGARKTEISRERVVNKYGSLFELGEKGRAIKWACSQLERTIEEIYDDIFTRNTQCLQNKNIGSALKALTLTSCAQLVDCFFRKKFKGSKLAATNLNNMLYSLSYYVAREGCPVFLRTFEDFLLAHLHHEDLLYYLFARNILKRELRVVDKIRDSSKNAEGTYFTEGLKSRDITRYLKGIIGKDSELLHEYRELILGSLHNDSINAYEFLRILLEDYHVKRLSNKNNEASNGDSFGNTLFEKDYSYDRRNTEELTFGEEPSCEPEDCHEQTEHEAHFWDCLGYSQIKDNLYDLIMEKMEKKVAELIEILVNDMEKPPEELSHLQRLLVRKAGCLVKAIFEMNKMKWFK